MQGEDGSKKPQLLLLAMLLGIMVFATLPPVRASSPFGLDGDGTVYACLQSGCRAQQLSTSHGNDLVILLIACDGSGCASQGVNITDSRGLSYTQRGLFQSGDNTCCANTQLAEYYAVTRAPLNSDNITTCCFNNQPDFADHITVFAVNGYNSKSPFDQSTPSFVDCFSLPTPPCSNSIVTSTSDFVFTGIQKFVAGCSVPPGWTRLFGNPFLDSDFQILDQPATVGVSYTCVSRQGFQSAEILMLDAVSLHTA